MPLRLRLALLFAGATAVVVALGAFVFVRQLDSSLRKSVDTSLRTRAADIAGAVGQPGAEPQGLLVANRRGPLNLGGSEAQILDDRGDVLSSTTTGRRPLITPQETAAATHSTRLFTRPVEDDSQRYISSSVVHDGRRLVIVVRSSMENSKDAIDRVRLQLTLAGIPLVLLAGLAGWWLAGAALRPVEQLRRQVADLGEDDVGPSLDVPGTRDEISALARTMNDLLSRVRRARRRERGFIGEAGHELRTPLAILQGELELAMRPGRSPEQMRAALAVAADESERLGRLAEHLLTLARSDEGAMPLQRVRTDIGALVERSADAARARARERGVTIVVRDNLADDASVDEDRFRQAVDNLLDNAIRHAPAGSMVEVTCDRSGDALRCVVADEGAGFPPEFIERALDRFAKAESADGHSTGGAGLGLAIVNTVATSHGGRAWVANRPSGGAEAGIEVPFIAD